MAVETIDRLVPHTSAEHANLLSINLDLHFPAVPCSELAIEVRDQTGTEPLKFRDSVSKLRTTAGGVAIGMPERLDFTERVALGMRLHRFMHVLGDSLAQLVRFSLRSGCARDYSAECPDHWEPLGRGRRHAGWQDPPWPVPLPPPRRLSRARRLVCGRARRHAAPALVGHQVPGALLVLWPLQPRLHL